MSKPKVLIEQWLPIDQIGAECMRERGASSALPPLYFLHVWWARRPLTVSRAAILASLLPAYPTADEGDSQPWQEKFLKRFPTFDVYKQWFLGLIGITGDPAAGRKLLEWAKIKDKKIPNPYEGPRAFTVNPSEADLETLYDLLESTWGTREVTFCDPMSGGGSIPFEALRFGLTVHANELNPVASVILKATLDYPARFGETFIGDVKKFGGLWAEKVQKRLQPFYTSLPEDAIGACYLWARTVACPTTGKPVPLSTSWWLRKGANPVAIRMIADSNKDRCEFQIVRGKAACTEVRPQYATVRRGTGMSPWTGEVIDNDYIKSEAQAGRMGQQLYAVALKVAGGMRFREPSADDLMLAEAGEEMLQKKISKWEVNGIVPNELLPLDTESWTHGNTPAQYDATTFADLFAPRQLFANLTILEELKNVGESLACEARGKECAEAILTLLTIALGKIVNYNTRQAFWDYTRQKVAHGFSRHDFALRWCFTEFDGAGNLVPWAME